MCCPLQVFSLGSGEFTASISNADISKTKTFSKFCFASMKSRLNSEYFEKKDQSHSLSITELIDCETGSYRNV